MPETKTKAAAIRTPAQADAMPAAEPFFLPYAATSPQLATALAACGVEAAILGRVTMGANARLGASSVIRADGEVVTIGDDFTLGDRGTVHIDHERYPAIVGDRVTAGDNAVIHACVLGNDIIIEDNVVVLDGSTVADHVVIAADAIVFPRSHLEGGKLYAGMPARPVRDLQPGELEARAEALRQSRRANALPRPGVAAGSIDPSVFLAATARLHGHIEAAANASIWFGCDLDANGGAIVIGRNTNIQDNTIVRCSAGGRFTVGADCTIGHNVTFGDCSIGPRSLVGIGCVVADGTIMEAETFLAAGAETTAGQVLEGGWLWGKRPAVKLAPLDQAKRELIATTAAHYCDYARSFAAAQAANR